MSMPKSYAISALAASGLLNEKVGGPSVHPPAPAFLFLPPASYGPKTWVEEKVRTVTVAPSIHSGSGQFPTRCCRHSMRRMAISPVFGESRSNTPLQALITLNEPIVAGVGAGAGDAQP